MFICDNTRGDGDVNVRDNYHITVKYRGSAHADCNINVKWNHKIHVVFHNLKNYDIHLIMQLGQFNCKIPSRLEKYTSFKMILKNLIIMY